MKSRDIIIGFICLVVLIAGGLWLVKNRSQKTSNSPVPTPTISQKVNEAFPSLNIPAGAERADLAAVGGVEGLGVATRQKNGNMFSITVMANLNTPSNGVYKAQISDGTTSVVLGNMNLTKSGYLVDFSSLKDLGSYNKVIVTLNGTSILEGSF